MRIFTKGYAIFGAISGKLASLHTEELFINSLRCDLGEFERRLLAEFRQEDRQVVDEIRPDVRPNYQSIGDSEVLRQTADRVLKSLTTGRGSFASTSPQFSNLFNY